VKRRGKVFLGVVVGSVGLAVAGLSASVWVKSPQEQAAAAGPPSPSVLTAGVEQRVLNQTLVLRGDVGAAQSMEVTPSAKGTGKPVVTAVRVKEGDAVQSGAVVLEVSGRPLIVLPGDKPAFRDLRPGYTGDDVKQLQQALKSLGFNPGEFAGTFGSGTKAALLKYFAKIGYPATPTGDNDQAQLAAAARQVTQAERAVADAKDALAAVPPAQKATPQKAVDRATEDLAQAKKSQSDLIAATGPTLPLSEYVFLPSFPARVDGLKAAVGAEVAAPAITLSSGALKIRATLASEQRKSVKPGMAVEMVSETEGVTLQGTVESIGELKTDKTNPANTGFPMIVAPKTALEQRLAGQNVRLTISANSSGKPVLVVPLAALFSGSDQKVSVIRRSRDGREERVAVTPGMQGDGWVAIDGALAVGDRVVIGVQQETGANPNPEKPKK
jgi:peptidoglycan hydrolase-like protein with peptidoglycan-binding domain